MISKFHEQVFKRLLRSMRAQPNTWKNKSYQFFEHGRGGVGGAWGGLKRGGHGTDRKVVKVLAVYGRRNFVEPHSHEARGCLLVEEHPPRPQ